MAEFSVVGRGRGVLGEWKCLPVRNVRWLEEMPRRPGDPRRSAITQPGYRRGCAPPNKGLRFPADPPTAAEVMRMLALCGRGKIGRRNHALIVCMWRTGLRVSEALDLWPHHIDFDALTVTVMSGKGSKRRTVGIDPWGAAQIREWVEFRERLSLPAGAPLFCTVSLPNAGRRVHSAYVREELRKLGERAGVPRRTAPHQLRHALAVSLAREGKPMHLIQRQLGHSNLGTTATYLSSIAPFEVVDAMAARPAPEEETS